MNGIREALLLVEFDSIEGPLIRMQRPKKSQLVEQINLEQILVWVIRASDFSIRKLGDVTIYARALEIEDPNYNRKKRQFGLALLTKRAIELDAAQQALDFLALKCKKEANNQAYFLILKKLLEILEYAQKELELGGIEEKNSQGKIISSRLNILKEISFFNKKTNKKIVTLNIPKEKCQQKIERESLRFESEDYVIQLTLQTERPSELDLAMNLFLRIIGQMPEKIFSERILCAVEYLDRLLYEEVDIEYFLSFLQYFIGMEEYSIIEFKQHKFAQELQKLQQTHGEWVQIIQKSELAGKNLEHFFQTTGLRRESLELLIDLLFIKIITIH